MTHRGVASAGVFAIVIAVGAFTSLPLAGQSQTAGSTPAVGAKPWMVAKTPEGVPDLSGTYVYFDSTPFETPGVPTRRRVGESAEEAGAAEARQAAIRAAREAEAKQRGGSASSAGAGAGGRAAGGGGDGEGGGEGGGFSDRKPVVPRRPSLVVDPPKGHVPIRPEAAQYNNFLTDNFYNSYKYMNTAERCITRGIPGVAFPNGYNSGLQIVQSPGYVVIVYEMFHEARFIPTDGSPHLPQDIRLWQGDSRGRWEGNTLVVDVTNFRDEGSVTPNAGSAHLRSHRQSEALHVVERFTPVAANTINYEVTIEDPKVYTGPWKAALPLTRDETYKIYEYACHEGNYNYMTNTLRTGRVQDKTLVITESPSRREAEEAAKGK